MNSINSSIYDVKDLSEILKLNKTTIRKFLKEGTIKANKIGKKWFTTEKSLIKYLHNDPKFKDIIK